MSRDFASSHGSFHQLFDLHRWSEVFPLDQLRREAREFVLERRRTDPEQYADEGEVEKHVDLISPHGEILVGPKDLAVVEQLRRELFAEKEVETVATAAFVFAKGEPADRRMTKLGGLPFRRADQAWPSGNRGQPLAFVGQLNFIDLPTPELPLPGEILLVFADPDDPLEVSNLRFEWTHMELSKPLAHDAPGRILDALFGVMHKTWDIVGMEESDIAQVEQYRRFWLLLELQGTKIAGCPCWIQADETPEEDCLFLGALGSISCPSGHRWPWVNIESPCQSFEETQNMLMWGDMGSLFLFWNGREILPIVQSY